MILCAFFLGQVAWNPLYPSDIPDAYEVIGLSSDEILEMSYNVVQTEVLKQTKHMYNSKVELLCGLNN